MTKLSSAPHESFASAGSQGPDVFAYDDYRAYLRDYYAYRKKTARAFSFRAFSKRAKLTSPNYLKLVMDGKRNLTASTAARFATTCGLTDASHDYFCALVQHNQSEENDRAPMEAQLLRMRDFRAARVLEQSDAAYHAHWFMPAVRELAALPIFRADPVWISKRMMPPITAEQAAHALDTLLTLGFLVRNDQGRIVQATSIVSTGAQTRGEHIINYHKVMIGRGAASLDEIPSDERDISSVTITVGPNGMGWLKERARIFRREILMLSGAEKNPSRVVQMNLQIFPLTHQGERK